MAKQPEHENSLGRFPVGHHSDRVSDRVSMGFPQVRDGSDWVLDGGKCWISNSLEAGVFVVFANADPSKGHRGVCETWENMGKHGGKNGKTYQNDSECTEDLWQICKYSTSSIQHGKTFKCHF